MEDGRVRSIELCIAKQKTCFSQRPQRTLRETKDVFFPMDSERS
jgi:hypothetical protein